MILETKDFQIDEDDQSIFGVLFDNEPTLLSYRIESKEYPEIDGFVYEYFQTGERFINTIILGKPLGTFFGRIKILKGWEIIKSNYSVSLSLIPSDNIHANPFLSPDRKLKPNEFYGKFKKMNELHELSSFFIDIRGGSTDGSGRNEHGTPHFHLLKKNTNEDLAKIEIPSLELWNKTENKIKLIGISNSAISKSQKKELVNWLQKDDNLQRLLDEWNQLNKYNNRALSTTE